MDKLTLLLLVLGYLLFTQGWGVVMMTAHLIRLPLWAPVGRMVQREQLGAQTVAFDGIRPVLTRAGFKPVGVRRSRSVLAIPDLEPVFTELYYHAEHDIHAVVELNLTHDPAIVCKIQLWNYFSNGQALTTLNHEDLPLVDYPASVRREDLHVADLESQVQHHLTVRRQYTATVCDPIESMRQSEAIARSTFEQAANGRSQYYRRGSLHGETVYGLRLLPALRNCLIHAGRQIKGSPGKPLQPDPALMSEADYAHMLRVREQCVFSRGFVIRQGLLTPAWFRRSMFLLSGAAFMLIGGWFWDWRNALAIGLALVLHEGGHWAAMKLMGYRDVQVYFVPGMGGATTGRKPGASAWTQLFVLLAGPMPGLLLGLGLAYGIALGVTHSVTHSVTQGVALGAAHGVAAAHSAVPGLISDLARQMIVVLIVLNWLNLLPVFPFDGGRVVDLLIVRRFPWWRMVFKSLSTLLLLALFLYEGDRVLLYLAFAFLLSTAQQYRVAKAEAALRRQGIDGVALASQPRAAANALFDFLSQPRFGAWKPAQRASVGQALMEHFISPAPNWKQVLGGSLLYLACLGSPLIVGMAYLHIGMSPADRLILRQRLQGVDHARSPAQPPQARLRAPAGPDDDD